MSNTWTTHTHIFSFSHKKTNSRTLVIFSQTHRNVGLPAREKIKIKVPVGAMITDVSFSFFVTQLKQKPVAADLCTQCTGAKFTELANAVLCIFQCFNNISNNWPLLKRELCLCTHQNHLVHNPIIFVSVHLQLKYKLPVFRFVLIKQMCVCVCVLALCWWGSW